MRQPTRFRNHYSKTVASRQRRNGWLLYTELALLAVGGDRWIAICARH